MGWRTNLTEEQYVQFSFLSEGQKRLIFSEVLEILQYTGVKIHHHSARELLRENGCTVRDRTVTIPSQLVHHALSSVPPVTTIHHWDGHGKLRIELGRTHFGPGPTCPNFIDPETLERRPYTRGDASLVARVCDWLPQISFVMSLGSIADVAEGLEDVHEFAELIQNSAKPVVAWSHSIENCEAIHQIACAMAGSEEAFRHRPNFIFYNEPISPLSCDAAAADKLMYCAENGIPQIFAPANTAGATVPATHGAHLAVTLAESLTGVTLSQLVKPGSCIIIGGTQSILDMHFGTFSYGAPELSILGAGLSEMAEFIGLPVFTAGGCSDAKTFDHQSALETTLSIHSAILSGATLVHDIGFLESGMTGSLHQLVLADEVISMARHMVKGIQVTEESMAGGVTDEVGADGDFAGHAHSKGWSEQRWLSGLDQPVELPRDQSSPDMMARVVHKTRSVLKSHAGPKDTIPQAAREAIAEIIHRAEKRATRGQS